MPTENQTLAQRWSATPRAAKWLIATLAVIVGYYGVLTPILDLTSSAADRADAALAEAVQLEARLKERQSTDLAIATGAVQHGAVAKPGSIEASRQGMLELIDRVSQEAQVGKFSVESRTLALRSEKLAGAFLTADNQELIRLVYEIRFEATPQTVTAVLAALESSDLVHAVGRVSMRKPTGNDTGLVTALITPETWVVRPKEGRS